MPDFSVKVTADTKEAEGKLRQVDESADKATRPRSLKVDFNAVSNGLGKVASSFDNLDEKLSGAANNIKKFYSIAEKVPVIGQPLKDFHELVDTTKNAATGLGGTAAAMKENGGAATILSGSLRVSVTAAQDLVSRLARLGMALFAVKEAAGMLQSAFGSMFSSTVGREVAFRESVLKMQTTLASSSSKITVGSKELVDPYERIVGVTSAIEKRIDSIRERSLELAGVTSEQVVETFGIVVSQAGQLGVSLKQAEDLAISFSGALGTFGIPLEQARQEINSIAMGNITSDSYLAKALNIKNEDIAKAKNSIDGVYGYLQGKLEAAVQGQKIAATSFAGVTSNIMEVAQGVQKAFGKELLDPLLGGLTNVYNFVFSIRKELTDLAVALGATFAKLAGLNFTQLFGGGSGMGFSEMTKGLLESMTAGVTQIGSQLQAAIQPVLGALRNAFDGIGLTIAVLVSGLTDLARALLSLQVSNILALVQAFSTLVPLIVGVAGVMQQLLGVYAQFLQFPLVQYISNITVQWQLLGKMGVWSGMQLVGVGVMIVTGWTGVWTFFQGLITRLVAGFTALLTNVSSFVRSSIALFSSLMQTVSQFFSMFGIGTARMQVDMKRLEGSTYVLAGAMDGMKEKAATAGMSFGEMGGKLKNAALSMVWSAAQLLVLQLAITAAIDAWGRYQQAQKAAADSSRATDILKQYGESLFKADTTLTSAAKRQREFNKALVEGEFTIAKQRMDQYEKDVRAFQQKQANLHKTGGVEGFAQYWGSAIESKGLAERMMQNEKDKALVAKVQKILDDIDKQATDDANIAANNAKTKQNLQDQAALAQSILERTQQQWATETQRSLLLGNMTQDQATLQGLEESAVITSQELLAAKQKLAEYTASGQFTAPELDKIKTEIAGLEGKQVTIEINVNRTNFDQFVKQVDNAAARASANMSVQTNALQQNLNLTQARASAETTVNNTLIAGLRTQLERAKSEGERRNIIERIYQLEIANAQVALLATREQIATSVELARLALEKEQANARSLQVKILEGVYLKQDVSQLRQALAIQQTSIAIAATNLETATKVAFQQNRAADATFQAAEAAAKLARENALAANNAGRYADNMQRGASAASSAASGGGGGGGSGGTSTQTIGLFGKSWSGGGGVPYYLPGAPKEVNDALYNVAKGSGFGGDPMQTNADINARRSAIIQGYNNNIAAKRALDDKIAKAQELESAASQYKDFLEKGKTNPTYARLADDLEQYWARKTVTASLWNGSGGMPSFTKIKLDMEAEDRKAQMSARFPENAPGAGGVSGKLDTIDGKVTNIASRLGSPNTQPAPTINLTTGPVFKFNGAEYVTVEDMNKAFRDYNDKFWEETRKKNSLRMEQALAWQ